MAYELKDNSGSLFRNEKREKDTHPHMQGKCLIDGVVYYISAWTKEGANGRFQSLAFKRADGKQENKKEDRPKAQSSRSRDVDDDSIPF